MLTKSATKAPPNRIFIRTLRNAACLQLQFSSLFFHSNRVEVIVTAAMTEFRPTISEPELMKKLTRCGISQALCLAFLTIT